MCGGFDLFAHDLFIHNAVTPGERGVYLGILGGMCRPVLLIRPLFRTKNCRFHTRCQTWPLKSIPVFGPGIRTPTKRQPVSTQKQILSDIFKTRIIEDKATVLRAISPFQISWRVMLGGGGCLHFQVSLRQTSHAATQPIEKETNKQTLSIKWWSYFLRNNNDRKTEKNKHGKTRENTGKERKTQENRGNMVEQVKQRKTEKNTEKQGESRKNMGKKGKT